MGEITEVIKGLIFPYICRHWYFTTSIPPQYERIFEQIELFGIKLLFNPLTAGAAYIRVFIFYYHIKYHLLNMLKIKCAMNQQYLNTVDLHFVKSE